MARGKQGQSKGLTPPTVAGRTYVPGFHRTKTNDIVTAIAYEGGPRPGRSGLYGPAFYMTRTPSAQARARMVSSYGALIIRCQVDITGFICFDQAEAKRVWGANHTLKDQLKGTKIKWTKPELELIDQYSGWLSAYWKGKNDAINHPLFKRNAAYASWTRPTGGFTSEVAEPIRKKLGLDKKVPGICYTGANDGPCVVAYQTKAVTPLEYCEANRSIANASDFKFVPFTDPAAKKQLSPLSILEDKIEQLEIALKAVVGAPAQRQLVYEKMAQKQRSGIAKLVLLAAIRRTKSRDRVLAKVRNEIVASLSANESVLRTLPFRDVGYLIFSNQLIVKTAPPVYEYINQNAINKKARIAFGMRKELGRTVETALVDVLIQRTLARNETCFAAVLKTLDGKMGVKEMKLVQRFIMESFNKKRHTGYARRRARYRSTYAHSDLSETLWYHYINQRRFLRVGKLGPTVRDDKTRALWFESDKIRTALQDQLRRWRMILRKHPVVQKDVVWSGALKTWWLEKGHKYAGKNPYR